MAQECQTPAVTVAEITIADEPNLWTALGFVVTDQILRLGGVTLRLVGRQAGKGITGWSLRGLASDELDGLPTTTSTNQSSSYTLGLKHPNGIAAIDHLVAMSSQLERSVSALQAAGLDLRGIREQPTPAGAPRQAFFRLGEMILEVVQEPADVVASSGGPNRPTRFWGLALLADDLNGTVERLADHVSEIRPAIQPGRRIATLRRSAGLAVPVALMSRALER